MTAEEELLKLEKAFAEAIVKNDLEGIGRLVTDDWIIIDPNGEIVDRARFFEVIKSGALTHEMMESEDFRVRVYGDSAVVTGVTRTKGKFMGQEFSTQERATDVFVKRDGRWQCVLTHLTRFRRNEAARPAVAPYQFRRQILRCLTERRYSEFTMKVEVEKQPGSVSKLQIELPADEVAKEWDAIANSFARFAKIPGYRPGKAPRAVIDKRFRKEIQDELTKKLVSKSYHEAVEQEQLRVASLTNIEDIEFGEDKSMRFRATVVTAPEFELPDYKNIPVQLPDTKISEAEVEAAIERLRDQSADFVDVPERALQMGDFAVLDFEGSIENKPISEIAPQASKNLHGGKKFWLHLAPENFLPKFCEQLIGLKPGETRLVIVNFPNDFPVKELAGKKADYAVTLREIKEKVLPPIDDALAAKLVPGKTLAALREMIEHDLEHAKEHDSERAKEVADPQISARTNSGRAASSASAK